MRAGKTSFRQRKAGGHRAPSCAATTLIAAYSAKKKGSGVKGYLLFFAFFEAL